MNDKEKVTFTLRMSTEVNERLKNLSKELSISQNSLIQLFIKWGITMLDNVSHYQIEELSRFLSQTPQ